MLVPTQAHLIAIANHKTENRGFDSKTSHPLLESTEERHFKAYLFPNMRGRFFSSSRKLPKSELEEVVFRGSKGNGGSALNTASQTVRLTHAPSGITVRVGDTRHLYANKSIARKRLFDKVEHAMSPETSKITRDIEKQRKRNAKSRQRARAKYGDSTKKD